MNRARQFPGRPILAEIAGAWDALNFAWDTTVLGFDSEAQQAFFAAMHVSDTRPLLLIVRSLLVVAVILGLYAVWLRLRARSSSDRVKALYDRFCRKAARNGVVRFAAEGPRDFGSRAASLLPQEHERIARITDAYIALRYSSSAPALLVETFRAEVRAFLNKRSETVTG